MTPRPPQRLTVGIDELIERARVMIAGGARRVLGIAGAPGAGKSTLADALAAALGDDAALVGMDGFHLANAELERLGRRDRKGAPDTFDVDGYTALLARLRSQGSEVIHAPRFDRALEESIGSAVPVSPTARLIITEGNYLLLRTDGWERVAPLLDDAWYLDVPAGERERRLIARRACSGEAADAARAWVQGVDLVNGRVVTASADRASLILTLR